MIEHGNKRRIFFLRAVKTFITRSRRHERVGQGETGQIMRETATQIQFFVCGSKRTIEGGFVMVEIRTEIVLKK